MKKILIVLMTMTIAISALACGTVSKDEPTTGALTMPDYTMEITGRVARFNDNVVMLISEESGAIVLDGEMNFEGLKTGDKITIYCDGVAETYPAQATVKEMVFYENGSVEDIDKDIISNLQGLGYELTD